MAEAEDVITDVARYATIYTRDLWLRRRGRPNEPGPILLAELQARLDLLLNVVFGQVFALRVAQPPAHPTLLTRLFRRQDVLPSRQAIPATNGRLIWLPAHLGLASRQEATMLFRTMALQQAMRATRGSAAALRTDAPDCPRTKAAFLLLEAQAADNDLIAMLPGMRNAVAQLRARSLAGRPNPDMLPVACAALEQRLQAALGADITSEKGLPICGTPTESMALARQIVAGIDGSTAAGRPPQRHALIKDWWTGDLEPAYGDASLQMEAASEDSERRTDVPRSARLPRRPKLRQAREDEDSREQGVWMIQTNDPLEKAEDPMGMQRPADRDEQGGADEYADALSELDEARLVRSSSPAKEILLSDDPPDRQSILRSTDRRPSSSVMRYPEWDYQMGGYRYPGAAVHVLPPESGPAEWVQATLARHRSLIDTIRRHFDALRPERQWRRHQADGDEIDLEACVQAIADTRAGLPIQQGLYLQQRPQARDLAIMLLADISGSTDSWLASDRRIIDVEREALLLVTIALERMGESHAIHAFSGEGPQGVTVRAVKAFAESDGTQTALRVAALEPQYYTRSGAALRHATAELMRQPVRRRLLLMLSDGKPNDADQYEGRYGIEDTKRAVIEAKMQGVFPFCLTIDRQAAAYLPGIFGTGQYALIQDAAQLPRVLVEWLRRLVAK